MSGLRKAVWAVLDRLGVGPYLSLHLKSALKDYGWTKSYLTGRSVDANGNPIPWYNYSFIEFLKPRIPSNATVFEYGAGNSTLWYAARVKSITSVEHDKTWFEQISQSRPANSEMLYRERGESYIRAVSESGKPYDIIIVDGRDRVKCTTFAADYLSESGVLILDNSDREWYQPAKTYLEEAGFRQIDIKGIGPIVAQETATSLFYRPGNCLGI